MTQACQPLVSAIVLSYNQSRFVLETLKSIKAQTYSAIQLIIVDDCSSDESVAIIERWLQENKLVCTFIRHQQNHGICKSLNDALAVAKGKYISMTASDDVWLPDKLARQVEIMESQPEYVGMLYSDAFQIDEHGDSLPDMFIARHRKLPEMPHGQVLNRLLEGNFIPAMTTLVRRSCYDKVGFFDENLPWEDWDMWMRIARHYWFAYSPTPSARYRVHSQSYCQSKPARIYKEAFKIGLKQLRHGVLSEDQRSILVATMLNYAMEVYKRNDPDASQLLLTLWQVTRNKRAGWVYPFARLGVSYQDLQRANGYRKKLSSLLGNFGAVNTLPNDSRRYTSAK
jgi:glycosyltransferase involved in cell wall biosynthesis